MNDYCILIILILEEGLMIVKSGDQERHLAYITHDREVCFKDESNLTNAEREYIKDFAKHTPHNSLTPVDKKTAMLGHIKYHKQFTQAGFSGVLSNGNIVDRRIFPDCIPMQKNEAFGIPQPKINLR